MEFFKCRNGNLIALDEIVYTMRLAPTSAESDLVCMVTLKSPSRGGSERENSIYLSEQDYNRLLSVMTTRGYVIE